MTVRCMECGAFMNNITLNEESDMKTYQCPNCKRTSIIKLKKIKEKEDQYF